MSCLYIFDLDGTLTTTMSGKKFRKSPDDWMPIPGRLKKVLALDPEIKKALATNQGGVAYGILDQEPMYEEILSAARAFRIDPELVFVCYTHPGGKIPSLSIPDRRRKPSPGMLLEAMQKAGIGPGKTYMIGDREEDYWAANEARCGYIAADEFFA